MHRLLERQLRKVFGGDRPPPEQLAPLLALVDAAYAESDDDRRQLESSLERVAEELYARNEQLRRELGERYRLEGDLRQAQKLEAVGQLAAGIAHEINTPIQFVGDNVQFLKDALGSLLVAVDALGRIAASEDDRSRREAAAKQIVGEADLDYLVENAPRAFERTLEGIDRVTAIVRAMKEFAHPDTREKTEVDINHGLANTLVVARNELKYVADVETDFGDLPTVPGHAGDLNQVFLNLLVNAAHAIGDVVRSTESRGKIRVVTRRAGSFVEIAVSDTGAGIPESIRPRIFEPFFTTKPVGKGTGQGLAIARSIIVDKHGGSIAFESSVGDGTTFTIRLPLVAARRGSGGLGPTREGEVAKGAAVGP